MTIPSIGMSLRYQSCCGLVPLSMGCLLIGSVGIVLTAYDIFSMRRIDTAVNIISIIVNVALITGVLEKVRFSMRPWMVFHILYNVSLWIGVFWCLFDPPGALRWVRFLGAKHSQEQDITPRNTFLMALVAIAHVFTIKVVFDHSHELSEEEQRALARYIEHPWCTVYSIVPDTSDGSSCFQNPMRTQLATETSLRGTALSQNMIVD